MGLPSGEQKCRHVDQLYPIVESVVEQEPDWADAVPRSTEADAPQPDALFTVELNGNETIAASPTVHRSS